MRRVKGGPRAIGPREHLLSELALPIKVELAYRRWGFYTVEDLMGRDPWEYVMPIGPEAHWIEWVQKPTYGGGTVSRPYDRQLESTNGNRGSLDPLEPWLEVRNIGVASVQRTLAAIEEWREQNRRLARSWEV